MSTLPGLASKGEKTKPKFQSLDINSLYRVSRGENLEKQQQKSTLVYKHGMQSLGKVPNARRAPANLPSLKSEYSGSDASIPLVPPGGPGWGKQDSTTSTTSTTTTTTTTTATPTTVSTTNGQQVPQVSSHQSAIALPVTTTIPPPTQQPPQQQQIIQQQPQQQQPQIQQQQPQQQQQKNIQSATPATTDKSWSSVMSGPDPLHPPPLYQSPQFQHEFPSLSVGDGVNGGGGGGNGAGGNGGQTRTDTQYTPGLSLRPQTEGSWIQGGSRTNADGQQRSNSVPLGGPPQLAAQGGLPQQPLPPQFRAVMPTFMYKGSFAAPGNGTPPPNPPLNGRNRPENRPPPRLVDAEDVTPRPIIKEEELIRMDEIDKDLGWTGQDDIDYNEKLAFSDDESTTSRNKKENRTISQQQQQPPQQQQQKEQEKTENHTNESQSRNWNNTSSSATLSRQRSSDEELWKRRTQHNKDLELTVQRAKQRKEEEEKRFNEATRQGAAKKLMELEEKMKRNREEDGVRTINPSEVPPKPIIPAEIPLPDFQKEKERDRENRSRTPNDNTNNNNNNNNDKARFDDDNKNLSSNRESSFRQLTQIEGKNFSSSTTTIRNKHTKPSERDRDREMREQNGSSYSRHYQNQVPPRFQKLRNNLNTNMQSQPPSTMHFSQQHQFDSRWMQNQNQSKTRSETPPDHHHQRDLDDDRREYKRQGSDDSHRSSTHRSQTDLTTHKPSDARFTDDNHDYRQQQDYDYNRRNEKRDDDKWQKDKDRKLEQLNNERSNNNNSSSNNVGDDWSERRDKYRDDKERYERPQRPDSRDSRTSRESRHSRDSEPREHIGSWAESTFETPYEERRRDHHHYHSHHQQHHHHQQQQHHHHRDDRRQVPGPITKERIEADDMKNEKRNLTQLKRGQLPEKKISDTKKDEKIEEEDVNESTLKLNQDGNDVDGTIKVWADTVPSATNIDSEKLIDDKTNKNPNETNNMMMMKHYENESRRSDKSDSEFKERDDKRGNRNRNYGSNKNWGGTNSDYHRSSWSKKPSSNSSNRGLRSGGNSHRSSGDIRTTDSEGSLDEIHSENGSRITKKFDKDDNREMKTTDRLKFDKQDNGNKRENYIPRGEPSRHGRGGGGGGGNFRTTRGGLSKRIDGYGPPPSKSPFGHHDDKEKKCDENSIDPLSNDKNKINQQSTPSAGVIGSSVRKDSTTTTTNQLQKIDDKMKIRKPEIRRGKSKSSSRKDDESNSDNSDDMKSLRKTQNRSNSSVALRGSSSSSNSSQLRRNNPPPPPRLSGDKKSYTSRNDNMMTRQNSGGALRSSQNTINKKDEKNDQQNTLCNAIADISLKDNLDGDANTDIDEKLPLQSDSDGFQEVKSKKTVKEKQKIDEKLLNKPQTIKSDKDINKQERKPIKTNTNNGITNPQLTQQQISNITSSTITTTTTLQQPSTVLSQVTNKNQFERPRSTNLAPRFAKQRESHRLQKAQQLQHNFNSNVNDINKMNVYNMKDTNNTVTPIGNAWDKTLGSPLRNLDTDNVLGVATDKCLDQTPSQSNSPSNDKLIGKANQLPDKTLLDGTTPPVNTIIFENTNFKSAPGSRNSRNDKPRSKLDDNIDGGSVVTNYTKPIGDLLSKNDKQSTESTTLQLPLTFKEDNANDIKLDFFESELSHLTADDKTTNKLSITSATGRSMHAITTNSNISTADALNFKIQSVKKMWETPSDHSVGQDDNNTSFSTSFVSDPNTLDPNAFTKGNDTPDDNHEVYSPSPNQVASNNTTNVCKVKPTQQVSGAGGQAVLSSTSHQQHSGIMGPSLMGNPLSPPPLQTVIGTGMNIGQPPQQYTTNQHISYQASLGGSNQYGISAIPSPPTVMYNSTQQLQAQTGLYGPFQIDQSGVLGGQGRSQYSQYPNHYSLGQTASSPYSTQSVYLQTAQPHPPPTAQAPPDIYQNMNNYRLSATGPFGQNQQLNNPTTVLISSTSNSLMSASVKPSNQQISAIGTKAGGVGQAYQQQSQQNQVYMAYEPTLQANYLQSAGVMQRAPTGPVQNNVVPTLQPSSSYYSGSTGQTGYFQQPGSSTLQSAQLQQHQAGYGLQGNVFGTHNQSHTNAGLQSFNSHFLSTPMQLAAALNAQQFRSNLPTQYMKGVGTQPIGDQSGRSQQLKSPGSQEVLSSVFNSGSQISSPKLRQNCKQPPPQPSPTAQHKYNLYQGVGNQQSSNMQRYPPPIQRPVNFQPNLGSVQQNSNAANKHRTNNNTNKAPSRQYYQANSLSSQNDKVDDTKLNDNSLNSTSSTNVTTVINKTVIGSSTATNTVNTSSEITKDSINIDEASALKD